MKNKVFTTFIVDDEPAANQSLEALLKEEKSVEITGIFNEPEELLAAIKNNCPDLIFLDIEMPVMDGFSLLKLIREEKYTPNIIFVTAFNSYAIEAIKQSAFDYLLKPVSPAELSMALRRLEQIQKNKIEEKIDRLIQSLHPINKIKLENSGGFVLIEPGEIIYCNADWNYSEIYLTNGKKEIVTMNIGKVEHILPYSVFFRINRSTIINLAFVTKINRMLRKCILTHNGTELSFKIPRDKIKKLEEHLRNIS
ncbi:MAG: LytR/AlgR family response regulator transcription factor [Bacteroidales bacterium]